MLALWAVAAWVRLKAVEHAIVGSDSLGPYLQAKAALLGHLPRPPNPESGDALWMLAVPIVAWADSLSTLFTARFVMGGVVAPLAFAAAWHWTEDDVGPARRWAAALTAGLLMAFDPGLVDTLVSGARTYGAPELVGLTTLGIALAMRGYTHGLAVAVLGLVWGAGHHPLAAGVGLGLLFLWPSNLGRGVRRWALGLGALLAVPRALRLGDMLMCGEGPVACLQRVAQSNNVGAGPPLAQLQKALHDRFLVDWDGGVWIVLAGVLAVLMCRRSAHRRAGIFALMGLAGLVLIGLSNGYLRSYHLRILAVPLAVAAGLGLARVWFLAPIGAAVAVMHWQPREVVGPDPGAVARHDAIAASLPEGPKWVDRVWWSGPPSLDASGVVLSAQLQGQRGFVLERDAPFILLSIDAEGWSTLDFPSADAARSWLDGQDRDPHQLGGAYDWATITDPRTRLEDARW